MTLSPKLNETADICLLFTALKTHANMVKFVSCVS